MAWTRGLDTYFRLTSQTQRILLCPVEEGIKGACRMGRPSYTGGMGVIALSQKIIDACMD